MSQPREQGVGRKSCDRGGVEPLSAPFFGGKQEAVRHPKSHTWAPVLASLVDPLGPD